MWCMCVMLMCKLRWNVLVKVCVCRICMICNVRAGLTRVRCKLWMGVCVDWVCVFAWMCISVMVVVVCMRQKG